MAHIEDSTVLKKTCVVLNEDDAGLLLPFLEDICKSNESRQARGMHVFKQRADQFRMLMSTLTTYLDYYAKRENL